MFRAHRAQLQSCCKGPPLHHDVSGAQLTNFCTPKNNKTNHIQAHTHILMNPRTPDQHHLLRVATGHDVVGGLQVGQHNVRLAEEVHPQAVDQSVLADAAWCDPAILHITCLQRGP